jgi:hypothetical protein
MCGRTSDNSLLSSDEVTLRWIHWGSLQPQYIPGDANWPQNHSAYIRWWPRHLWSFLFGVSVPVCCLSLSAFYIHMRRTAFSELPHFQGGTPWSIFIGRSDSAFNKPLVDYVNTSHQFVIRSSSGQEATEIWMVFAVW